MLSRIRQYVDSERKLGEYFFHRHFQSGFSKSIRTISRGFPKCFHILKGFKAFQSSRRIASNILRNKSALVMGIFTTFTCFQTLRSRKRGFLHETGFSIPHWYHFDGRSSSESKEPRFRLLEVEANAVIYFILPKCLIPRSHQSLNMFKMCLVKHGLKLFSL